MGKIEVIHDKITLTEEVEVVYGKSGFLWQQCKIDAQRKYHNFV